MANPLDSLAVLLNLQKQRPSATMQMDAPYDAMISDADLKDIQGAIGEHGRMAAQGGGSPYFSVPSRDELRQQGMAKLKQLFGTIQAQGEAKTMPERVKGEYGLAGARIKAGEAAQRSAEANTQRQTQRDFMAEQNRLNREALAGRQSTGIEAQNERFQQQLAAQGQKQKTAAELQHERDVALGKVKSGPGAPSSIWSTLAGILGMGGGNAAPSQAEQFAQQHYADLANLPDEQVLQQIQQDQPDATPDEIQQMLKGVQGLRGR